MRRIRGTPWLDLVLGLIVFLVALGPRLEIARAYDEEPQSEERLYNRYAVAWAQGEGAQPREKFLAWHPLGSFTHRPPAYVLFIGSIYRMAGVENYAAIRAVQAWLDGTSMVLLYALGVLVFGGLTGRAIGLIAALATARYDFLMLFVGRLLSETLYLWLTLVFLILAIIAVRRGWPLVTLIAAFVLGWANLTRPFLLFVLPGYLLWLAIAPKLKRRRVHLALAVLGMVLALGPVILRNWQFHRQFILISTNSGFTLYHSLTSVEGLSAPEELGDKQEVQDMGLGEIEESAEFRRRALTYMWRHPGDLPAIFGRKVGVLLAAKGGHKISHVLMVTPDDEWFYPLTLLGAALGLVLRPRWRWHPRLLVYGAIASQVLVSLLTNAETRYRVPIVPLLALLTAWGVWVLATWLVQVPERIGDAGRWLRLWIRPSDK